MTLSIELTPEQEAQLQALADAAHQPVGSYLQSLIAHHLGPARRQVSGYGKFAHLKGLVDALHAERESDRQREDQRTGA